MATNSTQFKKGQTPWNKGKIGVQVSARKGVKLTAHSARHKAKISDAMSKEKHPNWKGGRNYNVKYRMDILEILGFQCNVCGFDDVRALQVDHRNNDGFKERRTEKKTGNPYKLILEKVVAGSSDYQVLCANCNWIKRLDHLESNKQKVK